MNGLYAELQALHDRYPALMIENVSGGGNRLDLGMMRYTDTAWMDDRTVPAVKVRHNVQGLSAVFPPAYLLSFVLNSTAEPLQNASDLPLAFRSRGQGALGLCFRTAGLSAADTAAIAREVVIYKSVRPTLTTAASYLLTKQAAAVNGPTWDVLQQTAASGGQVILHAVQTDRSVAKVTIKPTGLTSTAVYEVRSVDTGVLGTATGATLATLGIDVLASPTSAAHLLTLTIR